MSCNILQVASISGRADMLAYLFSACAILCYVEACKKGVCFLLYAPITFFTNING